MLLPLKPRSHLELARDVLGQAGDGGGLEVATKQEVRFLSKAPKGFAYLYKR